LCCDFGALAINWHEVLVPKLILKLLFSRHQLEWCRSVKIAHVKRKFEALIFEGSDLELNHVYVLHVTSFERRFLKFGAHAPLVPVSSGV